MNELFIAAGRTRFESLQILSNSSSSSTLTEAIHVFLILCEILFINLLGHFFVHI